MNKEEVRVKMNTRWYDVIGSWRFTGRVKYRKVRNKVELYLEVKTTRVVRISTKKVSGHLWWARYERGIEEHTTKVWAHEDDFYFYTEPEEVVYECSAKSASH